MRAVCGVKVRLIDLLCKILKTHVSGLDRRSRTPFKIFNDREHCEAKILDL